MDRKNVLLACVALLLLSGSLRAQASYQEIGPSVCSDFFQQVPGLSSVTSSSAGIFSPLIGYALLITLIVMAIMGMAYAIAVGFGLESLRNFVKTEFLEQFFNVVLIAIIAGGVGFAGASMTFISAIGLAGASGGTAHLQASTTLSSMYQDLCIKYVNAGASSLGADFAYDGSSSAPAQILPVHGILYMYPSMFIISALYYLQVLLQPDGLGITFKPYEGLWPVMVLFSTELEIYAALAGLMLAVAVLLYFIFFLFPVFLYLGVFLRSFPWTRAAGGTLLALFISFYIVFPAILEPFTVAISPSSGFPGGTNMPGTGAISSLSNAFGGTASTFLSIFVLNFNGPAFLGQIRGFATDISYSVVQVVALVISFLISFDLLEALGRILGAPSLRSSKIFSRVI